MGHHVNSRELPIVKRLAPVESVDVDSRTVEVIWTAGADVERYDYRSGEIYMERLQVSDAAVRLDRLSNGGPVLDNHRAYGSVVDAFATVTRAWIKGGKGYATVQFCDAGIDERADMMFAKITGNNPVIHSLSCGYRRHKIEVDREKGKRPVWRVVDWEPFEISFVNVPADLEAQVRGQNIDEAERALFRNETVIAPQVRPNRFVQNIRRRAAQSAR